MHKGSNWLKCDLHIHTPSSFFHEYGDRNNPATWEKFISDLENLPESFKMIGINDYLTLDGYRKVLEFKNSGRLKKIQCILPVIEFRINRFAGESKFSRINFHVIFSDKISLETIQTQFLNAISSSYTLESGSSHPDWDGLLTDESIVDLGRRVKKQSPNNNSLQNESDWDVGFNNFNVDYKVLKEILYRPAFKDRTITALGRSEWNALRWDGGGAAEKRTIINETDIVFLASTSPQHYDAAKQKLKDDNVNDFLLDCSDAHYFSTSDQNSRIGNCNTWLKIEPTFNGLKQVLFEKEERVYIGENHPDQKSPYQVIKSIQFSGNGNHFSKDLIRLSSGLNSIIGGKSTGKSLLAGIIVKSSDKKEFERRESNESNDLEWIRNFEDDVNFNVVWADGEITSLNDTSKSRKVTYFPQHYLNSKINDCGEENKELNRIVRNILRQQKDVETSFDGYEIEVTKIDEKIAIDSNLLEVKLREATELKQLSAEKGRSQDIRINIQRLTQELSELKSKFDLTDEELDSHQQMTNDLVKLEVQKHRILQNIGIIQNYNPSNIEKIVSISSILNNQISGITEDLQNSLKEKTDHITKEYSQKIHNFLIEALASQSKSLNNIESQMATIKKKHDPILFKISNSLPLKEKDNLIKGESKKLEEVIRIENQCQIINSEIDTISQRLLSYFQMKIDASKAIRELILHLNLATYDSQLQIEVEYKCRSQNIINIFKERIKYVSNQDIRNFINNTEFVDAHTNSYLYGIGLIINQAVRNVLELKGDNKLSNLIQEILSNAIYLNYDLKLSGDSFGIMSPGKRALALLRVIIELDQSQHPIILDQPEDDLDNRSVYEGLASYLKHKKRHRQIIVVTHNPNVVVGADSEHVIVANQSGQESNRDNRNYRFEYVFGGLEDSFETEGNNFILEKKGIREHVCEILDGGKEAFGRREKLYTGF